VLPLENLLKVLDVLLESLAINHNIIQIDYQKLIQKRLKYLWFINLVVAGALVSSKGMTQNSYEAYLVTQAVLGSSPLAILT